MRNNEQRVLRKFVGEATSTEQVSMIVDMWVEMLEATEYDIPNFDQIPVIEEIVLTLRDSFGDNELFDGMLQTHINRLNQRIERLLQAKIEYFKWQISLLK